MVFIYILKLIQGKYYVGKTTNPTFRLDSHFNSNGSAWTMKYKPIKLLELIPNCDTYDEDKYTRKYMDKYGVDNVRGGSFVSIELDKTTIQHLRQMSNGTNDKCFICSKPGHFAKDCKEPDEYEEVWCCEKCNKEFDNEKKCERHEQQCEDECEEETDYDDDDCDEETEEDDNTEYNDCCFRCGREGHYATSCYASKHIKGYYLK
jgi:hypothetical protein